MKYVLVLYALIAIGFQVLIGQLTGYGQGSIGLLLFIFIVEIDPRFRFKYMIPNAIKKHNEEMGK